MFSRKLADEISAQIQRDILSYDWLIGITVRMFPGKSFSDRAAILIDAIRILCDELQIRVGNAELQSGKVHIVHWGENVDETISRLTRFIEDTGEPESFADGFWIGLPRRTIDRNRVRMPVAGHPPHTTN